MIELHSEMGKGKKPDAVAVIILAVEVAESVFDPVVFDAAIVDPPLAVGFKLFEHAKTNKSTCLYCGLKINKGDLRFQVRTKASKSMEHIRYIHATADCVGLSPVVMQFANIRFIRRKLDESPDHRALLQCLLDKLS